MRIKRWPHLRDMSLRHKIMTANFLMVFVPVLLIVILGTIIFAGLRFTGTLRQMELALLFIIWLGVYLARLLARQVLGPLAELRQAAAEIGRGNLDYRLEAHTHDEVGETCARFDEMRVALRTAREKQQQYEQVRRELLAGISHDLSTPLTALGGYASGLTDGIAATPERRQHYAERIQALVQQLGHLVDRLFLFSKLDLGRVEFHCEPTGLYDYMLEQVNRLRTVWTAQGVEIGFTAAEESGARTAMALLDREEFTRVLDNLLSNAAKYAGEADGSIHVEFALQTTAQAVRLSCRDHGPGVPEAELPHLFESFYRVDRSRGEKPGHGLGMAIASRIVLGMQGRIWAENATDGGLCIIMEFPRHDVGAEADRETEDIPAVEKG